MLTSQISNVGPQEPDFFPLPELPEVGALKRTLRSLIACLSVGGAQPLEALHDHEQQRLIEQTRQHAAALCDSYDLHVSISILSQYSVRN